MQRKSLILEEEEEGEDEREQAILEEEEEEEDDGDVEEVEEFSDVETTLRRGERVHSIVVYDNPELAEELKKELKGLNIRTAEKEQADGEGKGREVEATSGQSQDGIAKATMEGRWNEKVDGV